MIWSTVSFVKPSISMKAFCCDRVSRALPDCACAAASAAADSARAPRTTRKIIGTPKCLRTEKQSGYRFSVRSYKNKNASHFRVRKNAELNMHSLQLFRDGGLPARCLRGRAVQGGGEVSIAGRPPLIG